jgi:hypothetical protein
MTATPDQRKSLLGYYDAVAGWMKSGVDSLQPDAGAILAAAKPRFEALLDEIPYVDRPGHTMAGSMFACTAMLAVYQELRERGVDAHAWGRALHALPVTVPPGDEDSERGAADAVASQAGAGASEFVFEFVDEAGSDRGMNIKSCAICHLFGRHDAMDLVPYMCAYDDVMSDARGQGLRRTGTIALGASQCDFRFREGAEPLKLADQYPERIRLKD